MRITVSGNFVMSGYFIPVFSQWSWLIFVLTQVSPPTSRPISHSHCGMCYFVCCCLLLSSPHRHISLLCWPRPPLQITEVRSLPPLGLEYYNAENLGCYPLGNFPALIRMNLVSAVYYGIFTWGWNFKTGGSFVKEIPLFFFCLFVCFSLGHLNR